MTNPVYKILSESVNLQEAVNQEDVKKGLRTFRKLVGAEARAGAENLRAGAQVADSMGAIYGKVAKSMEKEVPGAFALWKTIQTRAKNIVSRINEAGREAAKLETPKVNAAADTARAATRDWLNKATRV